jgi:hypothetical protein
MRNKPSPIYPLLGVYTKVCFAYILVVRQQSETAQIDKYQKRENEENNNINF